MSTNAKTIDKRLIDNRTISFYDSNMLKFLVKKYPILKFLYKQFRLIFPDRQMFLKNQIYLNGQRIYKLQKRNIRIYINGENNIIRLNEFLGGGMLIIDLGASRNSEIIIGRNNSIALFSSVRVKSYSHPGCDFQEGGLFIGDNNKFNGDVKFTVSDSKHADICIGNDNLFAPRIEFKALADHLVYDIDTKNQINIEKGINIGNHNWICEKTTFLNKAGIGSNCVVGMKSLVNKELTCDNSVIAGVPASIKRTGINWDISVKTEIFDDAQKIC